MVFLNSNWCTHNEEVFFKNIFGIGFILYVNMEVIRYCLNLLENDCELG